MFKIMIVEDDISLNKLMTTVLLKSGYEVVSKYNASNALDYYYDNIIDLIVSDIMMPGMDGFEFAEEVRKQDENIPILFVTAKGSFEDKRKGFNIGIDDYMVKPIDINELVLRVEALLKRAKISMKKKLVVGDLELNYNEYTVFYKNREIILTQKEFLLLFKLLSYPDIIFTRGQLMDEIWGMDSDSLERTVDVHITRLRDRFSFIDAFEIKTVRGLGYKAVIKWENHQKDYFLD